MEPCPTGIPNSLRTRRRFIDLLQGFDNSRARLPCTGSRLLAGVEPGIGQAFQIAVEGDTYQFAGAVHHRGRQKSPPPVSQGADEIERRHRVQRRADNRRSSCAVLDKPGPSLLLAIVQAAEGRGKRLGDARAIGIAAYDSELYPRGGCAVGIIGGAEQLEAVVGRSSRRRILRGAPMISSCCLRSRRAWGSRSNWMTASFKWLDCTMASAVWRAVRPAEDGFQRRVFFAEGSELFEIPGEHYDLDLVVD